MRANSEAVSRAFFAGQYDRAIDLTMDSGERIDALSLVYCVGALTFVGRTEDAQAAFSNHRNADVRTQVGCHFFLGLAAARAGDFAQARALLIRRNFALRKDADRWARAFIWQGWACLAYFTGRYRACVRMARHALRHALDAELPYVVMLSTDMRGHALAQMGFVQRGVSLLRRAQEQAARLQFDRNVRAIECSVALYQARVALTPDPAVTLRSLIAQPWQDAYSQRGLLIELAVQHALRGRATESQDALTEATADAQSSESRRAKLQVLVARLHQLRWSEGIAACAATLVEARLLLDERDVAFHAELLCFQALLSASQGESLAQSSAFAELKRLFAATGHAQARSAIEQLDGDNTVARAFSEDELTPLLAGVFRRDELLVPKLLHAGLLALIPETLGATPGKRLWLLASENAVLVEDHGNVELRPRVPTWCPPLLRALAGAGASKPQLVEALWGLRSYFPERHDAPLRTAIHRLRSYLGRSASWVDVTNDGYRLTVPIRVVGHFGELPAELSDEWDPLEITREQTPQAPRDAHGTLLSLLRIDQAIGAKQLARQMGVSQSTVQRQLRELLAKRRVIAVGRARATRYLLRRL